MLELRSFRCFCILLVIGIHSPSIITAMQRSLMQMPVSLNLIQQRIRMIRSLLWVLKCLSLLYRWYWCDSCRSIHVHVVNEIKITVQLDVHLWFNILCLNDQSCSVYIGIRQSSSPFIFAPISKRIESSVFCWYLEVNSFTSQPTMDNSWTSGCHSIWYELQYFPPLAALLVVK